MTAVRAQLSTDERRDGDQTSACDHILGVLWHSLAAQNNGSARSNTCTQRRRRRVVRLVARRGGRRAAPHTTARTVPSPACARSRSLCRARAGCSTGWAVGVGRRLGQAQAQAQAPAVGTGAVGCTCADERMGRGTRRTAESVRFPLGPPARVPPQLTRARRARSYPRTEGASPSLSG